MEQSSATTGFLVEPEDVYQDRFELRGDEARHAARVLRVRQGQTISAVDGAGKWFRGVIQQAGDDCVTVSIDSARAGVGESSYDLRIVAGNIKSRNRLEVLIEKAVELGVSSFVVLRSARSVKTGLASGRAARLVRAATKQSGRSAYMAVSGPVDFRKALDIDLQEQRRVIVCHEKAGEDVPLAGVLSQLATTERLSIWIGPEGGFTDSEVGELVDAGASVVSLGPRRLRAETAGLVAAAAVNLLLSGASTDAE